MLRKALLSSDPAAVRPLAAQALSAIDQDMPAFHASVRNVLQTAVQSDVIWQLRYVVLLGLNVTDAFPTQLRQQSPREDAALCAFLKHLQDEHWRHLRGTRDPRLPGQHTTYGSLQEFTEAMTRWYIKY